MSKSLLLVSNTKVHGGKHFDHAREEIASLFHGVERITFVPYANPSGMGHKAYTAALSPVFRERGYDLKMIDAENPAESIRQAEAIFVGGGNTWQLLKELKDRRLLSLIRDRVNGGVPYLGSSAGSNVAGITIGNTNDMPAAEAYGRDALGLVQFNVNPHYQDTITLSEDQREAV